MEWLNLVWGAVIGFVISWQVYNPKIAKAKDDAEWEKGISKNLYKRVSRLEKDNYEQLRLIGNLRKAKHADNDRILNLEDDLRRANDANHYTAFTNAKNTLTHMEERYEIALNEIEEWKLKSHEWLSDEDVMKKVRENAKKN